MVVLTTLRERRAFLELRSLWCLVPVVLSHPLPGGDPPRPTLTRRELLCKLKRLSNLSAIRPLSGTRGDPREARFVPNASASCAVVGGGGAPRRGPLGEWIDAADRVIRFDAAPTRGWERYVGKREDIRVWSDRYPRSRETGRPYRSGVAYLQIRDHQAAGKAEEPHQDNASGAAFYVADEGAFVEEMRRFALEVYPAGRSPSGAGEEVRRGHLGPSAGSAGVLLALAICGEVVTYGVAAAEAELNSSLPHRHFDGARRGPDPDASAGELRRALDAERDLWRRLSHNPADEIDATGVGVITGFPRLQCPEEASREPSAYAAPITGLLGIMVNSGLAGRAWASYQRRSSGATEFEVLGKGAAEESDDSSEGSSEPASATEASESEPQGAPAARAFAGVPGQVCIVALFVLFGAVQALAVSASRGPGGKLPYDSAAAVSCSEAAKLALALGWVLGADRALVVWPPPRTWLLEWGDLSFVAALFALQNELNYIVIEYLGAVLFMLLGNLKIVFTVIFMRVLLGKRFAALQWVAVACLTLSSAVVKAPALIGEDAGASSSLSIGLFILLINTMSSGFAAVRNELIFKRGENKNPPMPFMLQNAVLYLWGLALNLISWSLWGSHSFLEGFSLPVWISVVCAAIFGLTIALMLRFLDNAVRCFGGVAQVLFTVVLSRVLPAHLHEGSFDPFFLASLVLLAAALVLYQAHQSEHLPRLIAGAVAASLVVGTACVLAERV